MRARQEIKELAANLSEARREICLLKAERDLLRNQITVSKNSK